jgi:ligand-binding sensor domain-containing protein
MIKYLYNIIIKIFITLTAIIVFYSCNKEVSVTPPDTPPPNGYIFLDSNPEGFQIYLNNLERGRITPDSLTWLGTGTYNITLKKNLYRDSSFAANVIDGKRLSIFVDFTKNTLMLGNISCSSTPSKAEIFLNDSSTGHFTPYTLQNILPGNYYIRYHLQNYRDDSELVTVSSSNYTSVYKLLIDTTLWLNYDLSNSSILSENLTCVIIDKNNIVYAGSTGNYFFSFDGKNWKAYYNALSTQINCSTIDNNNDLLFGTPRGFIVYNGSILKQYGFMTSGLVDYRVQTIAVDKESNWYIGTQGGLMEVFQPYGAMNWISYSDSNGSIANNYIVTAIVDNNDNVWAGILNIGVAVKKASSNTWHYYSVDNSIIQSNNITAIAAGPTGEVWIGYGMDNKLGHGLTCFDGTSWHNYYPTPTYSKTTAIFIDSKNVKWVGTDQGLVMFTSPASPTLFDNANTGLNISGLTGIAEDSYGNIWLSTDSGLYKYKGNR